MYASRNSMLVFFALTLAAIKFFLVPILESQSEAIDDLVILTQRLDRAEGVISNRALIEKSTNELESSTQIARKRFPDATDGQTFRLGIQQSVSAIAGESGLSVKLFEWVVDGESLRARLAYSRARVQMDGGFRQLATLQTKLEGRFPNMFVRELGISAPSVVIGPDESPATLTLVADFYYRPPAIGGAP